jgi:hypothetical protein
MSHGYHRPRDALIRYREVQLLELPVPELAASVEDITLPVRGIDVCDVKGGLEHRIELAPMSAIRVRFASVELNEILALCRDHADGGFRSELLSC